jgi:hypothetical protein
MIAAGWSPSVRLFEAAACGAPLLSDRWSGLEDFFQRLQGGQHKIIGNAEKDRGIEHGFRGVLGEEKETGPETGRKRRPLWDSLLCGKFYRGLSRGRPVFM